jgi:hypothetical protein
VAGLLDGPPTQAIAALQAAPGSPPGPTGLGAVVSPQIGAGWEVFVRSYADYTTLLCQVPTAVVQSLQCVKQMSDVGSGSVTLDMDAPWWKTAVLAGGATTNEILDFECLWQVTQDGVARYEFLGETITEQLVDASEQRLVTVTGPSTMAVLKWAMAAPSGFPSIILKLDGLLDDFGEIGSGGAGVLDSNIWTNVSPSGSAYVTPVPQTYYYPGGAGYSLSSLYPSGTLTIAATSGTTLLGSTPWDATDTLISAQIAPVGAAGSATDSSGNAIAYGTGLDGSELTQMYVESLKTPAYVAGFGLSAQEFYTWFVGPGGTTTHVIVPSGSYDLTNYAYWMITEQGGTGGGTGTFYWWTSPDGSTWTQQWSAVHTWDATEVGLFFTAKYDTAGKSAILSSINSNVTTPSYQGNIYLSESAMGIWTDLLTTAQARGTIPFVTTAVTGTADSFGNPWTDIQNVQVTNGTDLFIMLQSFCSVLDADFVMQPGFKLQVGQDIALGGTAVSLGTDRSAQVVFREGKDELAKQRTRARDKIANSIGVENSDGREISASSSESVAEWDQREGWFQTSALVDPVSMEIAAAAFTAAADDEVLSWTLSILPNVPGRTVFSNFDVGDWVGLERPDFTAVDAVRVIAIAVQVDQDGLETHELTLVSYLAYLQEQFTYISNKLGGGFVDLPGTTPVAPSKYGIGQVPTWFSPAATLANLADVIGTGAAAGEPLVYNPATGQWQPATAVNPATGTPIGMSVASPSGTVSVSNGAVTVSGAAPAPALDGGTGATTPATVTTTPSGTVIKDGTGSTRVTIGQQLDGTVTVVETNGPPPAAPDIPVVTAGVLGLVVGWDGLLAAAAPLSDFKWVEVHVSTSTGFTPSSATLQGTMVVGGLFGVGALTAGTTYYVKLMARNKSGVAGTPSTQASGVPLNTGTGVKVTTSSSSPLSPSTGDLWYDSATGNSLLQWSGSAWVAVPFGAGAIATGSITSAQIASSANILGSQLSSSAGILGSQLSGSAGITAGQVAFTSHQIGGPTVTVAATAPTSPAPIAGDIWYNSASGYEMEQYSGSAWVAYQWGTNSIAASAITSANILNGTIVTGDLSATAGITAGQVAFTARSIGGIATTIASSAPGSPTTGDLWFDSSNGYKLNQYSGSAWVAYQYGTSALAAGSITAAIIAANTITAGQIAAGTITTTQIASATILAGNIAANTITASQIAAGTITATQLAAGSVTAAKILASTITSAQIAAGTITAAELISGIVIAGAVNGTTITGAELIADSTTGGQVLIYNGTPASGNLVGSWSGSAGTDGYGNAYPSGISASTGTFAGPGIEGAQISDSTFSGGSVTSASVSSPAISGGTISETQITFDQVGGVLLVYTTTTTTATITSGTFWAAPAGTYTQGKVECSGADASGGGGNGTAGGEGGGGGAYSCEPSYPLIPGNDYSVSIGAAGTAVYSNSAGDDGGQTAFDGGGVVAYGGNAGPGGFVGGTGGAANSGQTISYAGGNGGSNNVSGYAASAGGGGRAGSSGPGGSGGAPTSSTGPGAAGTAGSGTGGHAGGAGVLTSANGNAGGGGSGAGKAGSGTTYQTLYYDPTSTASYYGAGQPGWAVGSLRGSNGSLFQGTSSGDLYVTGDQASWINYNYSQIRSDWSGWTIDQVTLTINNQHSWYNSGCYCVLGWFPSAGDNNFNTTQFWTDEGTGTVQDITSVFGGVIASTFQGFILGPSYYTSGGSTDLWNYGYFQGNIGAGGPRITIHGHTGSGGSYLSGAGPAGVIKVTYTSAATLIGAIAPMSGTDGSGNAFGAGFTGQMRAIQPGSSPTVVEVPHSLPLATGWTVRTGGYLAQYYLGADGRLYVDFQLSCASQGPATLAISTALPAGYWPAHPVSTPMTASAGAAAVYMNAGDGILRASIPASTILIQFSGSFPMN